ncbi:MAG: hypothetical protein UGF89_07645, partial [Acutalibacteraceae bacterium]|nr:hypothetical protein [Acutalibacteraceae bacterium]
YIGYKEYTHLNPEASILDYIHVGGVLPADIFYNEEKTKDYINTAISGNIINLANVLAEICGKASFNLVNLNIKRISDTRITIYFENKEWLYHRTNTFSLQKSNNVGVCFKV